ncbi:ATP-binding protein [Rhodocytophaga aerolata]|uniref:histidine kinase n=1 Tax=Rhodocytophaga aerolata TaxID=455078 RepID=A0ABT8R540_9BACT|nr:ATP-binding protein [Rhodocytophaga aerolata]MDO1446801.1 ATP-binding protein [Rhodocytophaga aerolata]
MKLKQLENIDLFADLSEEELLCDIHGEMVEYKAGEQMWLEGDEAKYFMVVLEGTFQIYRIIKGQRLFISTFTKGMTGGELPLLAGTPHPGNASAMTDVKLFRIDEDNFWQMLGDCVPVRKKILKNMANRLQEINLLSFQREKLLSLGTMAAGLAHELNNPASAAKRASQNLLSTLDEFDHHSTEMLKSSMFKVPDRPGFLFQPIRDIINIDIKLSSLERSEREDDLIDWMEELGLDEAWDIASMLVAVGFTKENLSTFCEQLLPEQVPNFLRWMHKEVEMRLLSQELTISTTRISDLVTAIKQYSYMDQNLQEAQKVNIHEGINSTLIILNHKLKTKRIQVIKEYDEGIPLVAAYGSELNQVWTNLIDNAIDAVSEGGTISIRTYIDDTCMDTHSIAVAITDNGIGIPKEVQARIFEPFFTTKGVGKGTGLGLEIAHRIIVGQHKGDIEVSSEPGHTTFTVYVPEEVK